MPGLARIPDYASAPSGLRLSMIIRRSAPELRHEVRGDRLRLLGRGDAPTVVHVADDRLPIALLPLDDGDPLEIVANRAARLDQFLAGRVGQRDRTGRRGARAKIRNQIL